MTEAMEEPKAGRLKGEAEAWEAYRKSDTARSVVFSERSAFHAGFERGIAEAAAPSLAPTPDFDVRLLEWAGFQPPDNVCRGCHHDGGDHDLNNRCLICGDCFSSMSAPERWEWGAAEYRRLAAEGPR